MQDPGEDEGPESPMPRDSALPRGAFVLLILLVSAFVMGFDALLGWLMAFLER